MFFYAIVLSIYDTICCIILFSPQPKSNTAFLKALAGKLYSSGEVIVNKKPFQHLKEASDGLLGYVMEDVTLPKTDTVRNLLEFSARYRSNNISKNERHAIVNKILLDLQIPHVSALI